MGAAPDELEDELLLLEDDEELEDEELDDDELEEELEDEELELELEELEEELELLELDDESAGFSDSPLQATNVKHIAAQTRDLYFIKYLLYSGYNAINSLVKCIMVICLRWRATPKYSDESLLIFRRLYVYVENKSAWGTKSTDIS